MARIKIKDLPRDIKISRMEMMKVTGGLASSVKQISIYNKDIVLATLSAKSSEMAEDQLDTSKAAIDSAKDMNKEAQKILGETSEAEQSAVSSIIRQ